MTMRRDAEIVDLDAYRLEVHPTGCFCRHCRPPAPVPAPLGLAEDARRIAAWCAAGVSTGLLLAALLDRLTGGPGLGVMLGW